MELLAALYLIAALVWLAPLAHWAEARLDRHATPARRFGLLLFALSAAATWIVSVPLGLLAIWATGRAITASGDVNAEE
jgi:hypothetical protein